MNKRGSIGLALCAALALTGCTNTIKYDSAPVSEAVVHDIDVNALQQSTTSMISAMVSNPQVLQATKAKRPVLAVFGLVDFTGEGVNITALNNDIYTELNKSARFRFADSSRLSQASQQQQSDLYQLLESPQAAQPLMSAVDADYLLIGEVSKVIRTQPSLKETFYRVSLKLVDPSGKEFMWEEKREFLKSQKKIVYGI